VSFCFCIFFFPDASIIVCLCKNFDRDGKKRLDGSVASAFEVSYKIETHQFSRGKNKVLRFVVYNLPGPATLVILKFSVRSAISPGLKISTTFMSSSHHTTRFLESSLSPFHFQFKLKERIQINSSLRKLLQFVSLSFY